MAPSAATLPTAKKGTENSSPALLIPFNRAALEHEEPFVDSTLQLTANNQQQGPFDVVAYGFMRSLKIEVSATAGAGTSVTGLADAPFTVLTDIVLMDVNGQPIFGPFTGYDAYLATKFGGYKKLADPKQKPSYSAIAAGSGNFNFSLRIPVEISNRDALGALANQSASATYKLRYSLAPANQVYGTLPTTLPLIRTRVWLEAWTQPAPADGRNFAQAQYPPAHGTTQFWSKNTISVAAGFQTIRLVRVGNYIRELIYVWRDASGSRSGGLAGLPTDFGMNFDTRPLYLRGRNQFYDLMAERHDLRNGVETAGGLDNGVFVDDFCHDFDGRVGEELRDGWLPTAQSSRLELQGTFAAAGQLTILTNDVAPAGEVFL